MVPIRWAVVLAIEIGWPDGYVVTTGPGCATGTVGCALR